MCILVLILQSTNSNSHSGCSFVALQVSVFVLLDHILLFCWITNFILETCGSMYVYIEQTLWGRKEVIKTFFNMSYSLLTSCMELYMAVSWGGTSSWPVKSLWGLINSSVWQLDLELFGCEWNLAKWFAEFLLSLKQPSWFVDLLASSDWAFSSSTCLVSESFVLIVLPPAAETH